MSSFESTKGQFSQEHFTVVEIDLPAVEGECTVDGVPGYGTPITCDQPSNATKTYKFRNINSPDLFPESGIYRMIDSVSETPTKIKPDKGLAARGTATITLIDSYNKDPNPFAPAVTDLVKASGGFIAKLNARNELTNKECRIKNYRVEQDGTIDLVNGAETKYYIIESLDYSGNNKWSLKLKDELSRVDIDEAVWPIPLNGYFRIGVDDSTTTFPVDPDVDYKIGDIIRSGEEFSKVNNVSGIGTGGAQLVVSSRGVSIGGVNGTLTRTDKEEHESGDEIFVCEVSDGERIDDLLERILLDIGIEQDRIPKSEWTSEVDEWLPGITVNTIWYESEDVNDVLGLILGSYNIDMWFDPVAREIKISAVSVWKESSVEVKEGAEINQYSIRRKKEESLRATRAITVYDKRFLARSDDTGSYKRASQFIRSELELPDLFGEPKTKNFGLNRIIDQDAADLLVNRHVNRFIRPESFSWKTPERKLNYKTGDIVDITFDDNVGFDGLPTVGSRAQITSVQTMHTENGREYKATALSYEPVFTSGSEIVITGNITDVNLFTQYAGAPSQPVELTFVFDGVTGSGSSPTITAIRAGAFPTGSKLILILANGSDLMAKGGNGGEGGSIEFDKESGEWVSASPPLSGVAGGTVFDAQGIDCDIYFSGPTPSASYPTADGYIFAPSGGDGGFSGNLSTQVAGDSGDGGDGRSIGIAGQAGQVFGSLPGTPGVQGNNGTDDRGAGVFGMDGLNNNATGGERGKGVVDNGATVIFFGDNSTRYVNGGGDH